MENKTKLKKSISNFPYLKRISNILDFYKFCRQNLHYPSHFPGHFYTPVISLEEIQKRQKKIFIKNCVLKGIDLKEDKQLALLDDFKRYYYELPFSPTRKPGFRYYYENEYFGYSDAIHFYSVMRHFKPRQVIEVGSGFSSCLIMDMNEHFFNKELSLTFIDPYPQRLNDLKKEDDCLNLHETPIQEVDPEIFKTLQANDILFIDSTHIVKTGSDVNYLLFEILPVLNKGVLIHFHDIQFPFEYPAEWVLKLKRSWNENYFLRAFLMYNKAYEIICFDSFMENKYEQWYRKNMPLCLKNDGGSIWLSKSINAER